MALNTIKASNIEDGTVAGIDFLDNSLSSDNIAALSSSKLSGALPALNGSALTGLTSANLVGALPALDGTALTGIVSDFTPLTNSMARLALHIGAVDQLAKYNMVDQVIDNYEDATGVVAYLDSSDSRHVVTVNGSASVSTIQKKFGTDSLYFLGGTSDSVTIPSHADLGMGSGDFTIEFWMYRTGTGGSDNNDIVFDGRTGATSVHTPTIYLDGSASHSLRYFSNGGLRITGTTAIALNTWFHVAIVRSSNSIKLYLNGTQEGATYSDSNTFVATPITIGHYGAHGSLYGYQGYIDEVRMSKGIARWTANFTPPTAAYITDSYTKLLIHGDTGSSSSATRAGSAGAYYYHGANSNMTLISESTTAESTTTKASIVLQTEDSTGTATINTDVKAGVSRDALNYVDTTLAKVSTWGSGNVYAANDVTIPGTVMTKIITVAASKLVTDGTSQATLTLTEGYTYKFDTSDSTLSGHTFSFATAADAAGSTQYTTGVTTSGTPGNAGAYTQIVVAASAPTLYYYCANHATMGGTANTPAEAATTSMRYKVETKNQTADIIAVNNDLANGTNADYNNYTFRQIIPASVFSSNQTKIQIKFRAGNVYPNHFVNTYVGHKASSGNAWDYESAPTRITWGGGNNQTNIGNGTTATSDVITFALDSSKDLILAIDFSSGGNQQGVNYKAVGSTGWTGYAKGNYSGDPSNGAVATTPSGYSADNNIYGFDQIIFPGKITRVHGTSLAWS